MLHKQRPPRITFRPVDDLKLFQALTSRGAKWKEISAQDFNNQFSPSELLYRWKKISPLLTSVHSKEELERAVNTFHEQRHNHSAQEVKDRLNFLFSDHCAGSQNYSTPELSGIEYAELKNENLQPPPSFPMYNPHQTQQLFSLPKRFQKRERSPSPTPQLAQTQVSESTTESLLRSMFVQATTAALIAPRSLVGTMGTLFGQNITLWWNPLGLKM
eukprot:PhF_6_TR35730/c0_g1_i1/m.51883